jgi:hypothetical protein
MYDSMRSRYLGVPILGETLSTDIPDSYNTQKENYVHVQQKGGSTYEDILERRRIERWQRAPLSEKKVRIAICTSFSFLNVSMCVKYTCDLFD